jgi:hypothetical protein
MEQNESLVPKEDIESSPQIFTNTDLELIPLLSQIDSSLVSIVKGVRRVLNDIDNPDRFAQAANSIRHLTSILIRNAQDKISVSVGIDLTSEQSTLIDRLSGNFRSILSSIPEETDDKQSYVDYLEGKFTDLNRELKLSLKGEPLTTKQVLKSYFGREEDLSVLQEFVQKRIKEAIVRWHNCHKYFVKISHYSNDKPIEREEFSAQWEEIQRCVLMVLRPFFSTVSIIDEIMKLEEPPNG